MSERHTKLGLQHAPMTTETSGTRTAATRASDTRPFKPYVYKGGEAEPPAVIAARERHRALTAAMEQRIRELEARQDGAP